MQRKTVPYLAKVWVPTLLDPVVAPALNDVRQAAGGSTSYLAHGAWASPQGAMTFESIAVYEFSYGDDDWQVEPSIYHLAQAMLDNGEQAVLIEINGRRVLLTP